MFVKMPPPASLLAFVLMSGTLVPRFVWGYQFQMPTNQLPNTSKFQIPKTGGRNVIPGANDGWRKSAMSPLEFAQFTDKAISYLRNTKCIARMDVKGADGSHGFSNLQTEVKDKNTFSVEYSTFTVEKGPHGGNDLVPRQSKVIADGKRMAVWLDGTGFVEDLPLAEAKYSYDVSPGQWPLQFPKLIFAAIRGGHPFETLVKNTSDSKRPYSVVLQERKFTLRGVLYNQKRLSVLQKGQKAPIFAATIDGTHGLPVTILARGGVIGHPSMMLSWLAKWGTVNSFQPEVFAVPNITKTSHS